MDLMTLGDGDFAARKVAVLVEDDRRSKISGIPAQITTLRGECLAAGGDPADLT